MMGDNFWCSCLGGKEKKGISEGKWFDSTMGNLSEQMK